MATLRAKYTKFGSEDVFKGKYLLWEKCHEFVKNRYLNKLLISRTKNYVLLSSCRH